MDLLCHSMLFICTDFDGRVEVGKKVVGRVIEGRLVDLLQWMALFN